MHSPAMLYDTCLDALYDVSGTATKQRKEFHHPSLTIPRPGIVMPPPHRKTGPGGQKSTTTNQHAAAQDLEVHDHCVITGMNNSSTGLVPEGVFIRTDFSSIQAWRHGTPSGQDDAMHARITLCWGPWGHRTSHLTTRHKR